MRPAWAPPVTPAPPETGLWPLVVSVGLGGLNSQACVSQSSISGSAVQGESFPVGFPCALSIPCETGYVWVLPLCTVTWTPRLGALLSFAASTKRA